MHVHDLSGNLGGPSMRGTKVKIPCWCSGRFSTVFLISSINVYIKSWRKPLGNEKPRKISLGEFFLGDTLGQNDQHRYSIYRSHHVSYKKKERLKI